MFAKASKQVGAISKREFFIAGLFLYWAEGGKTNQYNVSLSNTDLAMIRAFIKWLRELAVPTEKMIFRLHLYADMNVPAEIKYWQSETLLPPENFRKPYIKKSKLTDLTYTSRGHGTCNVFVYDRDTAEFVHQALAYIQKLY